MRKSSSFLRLLLTVAVTTACPGCSSKNTTTPDGSLACTEDSDCPNGQFCDQGICRPAGGDSDTACVDDIDCPDGMVCVEGSCKQVQDGGSVEESAAPEPDIEIIDPPLTGDPPVYLLDFGSVMVGQVVSRNISIRNAGDSDLRIIELSKEMGTSDEFYLDQALLDSLPLVVPPGQQTSIEVFYLAADGFSDTGVLNIISNDPDEARVPVQLSSTFKGTAKIAVDPARIDFGDVPVGLSGKMDITISNQGSGNAVLTLQAVQLASLVTDNFEIENPPSFPYYLNRGDVLVLSVMFHPGQAASFSDKLVVLSDDPASDRLEIPVSGRGVEPSLVVEPSPIDIGEVALGSSASVEVTVRNDGGAPLSITGIELANGTNEFQLTSDPQTGFDLANIGPANPQVLDAGEARKLTITYTPSDEGADSATLEIGSPDIEPSPRQVAVQATGFMPPVLSVQPLALDFGQQHVRGMSTLPVELRNDGGRILQFSSLQVSGIDSFSYSPASVPSLAAGQRFELQVTFAPLTTGTHLATLQISSNDPANPQVDVGLRGEGIDPNIFVWPPPPIDFGQIYRGTSSTQTIRIYSVGIGPLEVYSIELLPSPSDFSLLNVPALPATISNSSEWIEFDIKYAPPSVGADSVALRIESSDLDNSTLVVNVQGEAIGCPDGWWDIDGDPQNGCEYRCYQSNNGDEACDYIDNDCDGLTDEDFDVTSDPQNCGACNQDCVYNHATAVCNNGVCGLGACDPNFWNANGDDSDGCEYACVQSNGGIEACDGIDNDCDGATDEDFDLQNDPMNCGGCGNQCLLYNATSVCIQGTCRIGSCQVGYDNCDLNDVNGCETDLKADPDNCGTCGNVCSFPNAPALCNNGTCQPGDCSSGFLDCNNDPTDGCETNAQTDAQNCGSCGTACDPGESCESGQCRCGAVGPDCQNGLSCCGIDCVDLSADDSNCGSCGTTCQAGETCVAGSCSCGGTGPDCQDTEICCGQNCFDPLSSVLNCGSCGNSCDAGELCVGGSCKCGGAGSDCSAPLSCCGTQCVDISSDEQNCGSCGNVCSISNAFAQCQNGSCVMVACNTGWADCNNDPSDGCETNLQTDESHCGSCTTSCSNQHGTTVCLLGACVPTCSGLWADCDGDSSNGCETPTNTLTDCGGCGIKCDLPNATDDCSSGTCQVAACDAGYADCNSQPGCETDILSDVSNCGGCNRTCSNSHGSTQCTNGVCDPTCVAGWGNCDGDPNDGCETPLTTLVNCGACGQACSLANADETCSTGTCLISSCNSGFADCNSKDSDGCEVDIYNDVANCGSCGNSCVNAHGTTTCVAGNCAPSCDPLWGDCDGNPDNGCETSLATLSDCGSCGNICSLNNATASCSTGSCLIASCNTGYADCDGQDSDGCEADLRSDTANCGSCGNICSNAHGTTQCVNGTCTPSCDPLWGDCDGNPDNGCETPLNTLTDCGSCNTSCAPANATGDCSTGSCAIASCNSGYTDCNTLASDGCETHTAADASNCGGCGISCSNAHGTTTCVSGVCTPACDSLWGDCDSNPNNGCETPLNTLSDCGSCNTSCSPANASGDCSAGTCGIASCNGGFADCNSFAGDGCETNIGADIANCGACGNICSNQHGSTACSNGTCSPTCAGLWGDCDSDPDNGCETPLNTLTDCGSCGTTCDIPGAGETCADGTCQPSGCNPGLADCNGDMSDGCETDIAGDVQNCGRCGNTCTNPHGTTSCVSGNCSPSCTSLWGDCDGDPDNGCETSLATLANCGGCGISCSLANATEDCSGGVCQVTSCDAGFADCNGSDSDGCEVDLLNDVNNCGACGNVCSNAHGSTSCVNGTCQPVCSGLYGDCDGNPDNGCETPLNTLSNCGSCGSTCSLANATEDCSTGSCQVVSCDANYADCNGTDSDGCEANLLSDISNCGACGTTCTNAHGSTTCSSGTCVPTCDPLWGDCDGNPNNGCETPLTTLSDCGSCGTACVLANASEDCSAGTCTISSCDAGFADCNGIDSDGCEKNTSTDVNNCGSCGTVCTNAHGTTQCLNGSCTPSCDPLWGDCDGNANNGCEASLTTLGNCGACGVTCDLANAAESCSTGVCLISSCFSGYGDCDGLDSNGCETDLNTDVANCGACNNACTNSHGTTRCTSGTCDPTCASLWGNCDGDPVDGCETPLNTLSNCGSCGQACNLANADEDCSTGTCNISACNTGWDDCDGQNSTGCETYIFGDMNNCGSCGTQCALAHATESCTNGSCVLVSCDSGWWDIDGLDSSGCECGDTSDVADVCSSAQAAGTVSPSSPTVTRSGVIAYRVGYREDMDCYKVTYSNPYPGSGRFYVDFNPNPGNLVFQVWRNSCTAQVCAGDVTYTSTCSSAGPSCTWGNSNTFYVCVKPATGAGNVCQPYTIRFRHLTTR